MNTNLQDIKRDDVYLEDKPFVVFNRFFAHDLIINGAEEFYLGCEADKFDPTKLVYFFKKTAEFMDIYYIVCDKRRANTMARKRAQEEYIKQHVIHN